MGELARQRVEVAQALHRDQERLVLIETGFTQRADLIAEVVFELLHIDRSDRLPAAHEGPPLPHASLQPLAHRSARSGPAEASQMPRSVASTSCQWRR